ncbi:MAG: A24 family peptidase C-terminal domain-containing protein [Halobacteriota archaeon]
MLTTSERVWYSPGIPFVLLIAAGLLVAVVYGDLFLSVTGWLAAG